MSPIDKIRKEIELSFGVSQLLDNLVHDQASRMATAINNNGLKAQLEFLNQAGLTDENVLAHILEATDG